MKTKSFIRKSSLTAVLLLLAFCGLQANNVTVSNVQYISNGDSVKFDVSWENSWRNTGVAGSSVNYDGVWVFVKFRHACATDSLNPSSFQHMWLATSESSHVVPSGDSLKVGLTNIGGTNRGMGVFLYRSTDGTGNMNITNVRLKWDKLAQGFLAGDIDWDVRVYAFEMVYIPTAAFWVGEGSSASYGFRDGNTNNPLKISSENALTMGTATGNLNGFTTALSGTLNANFPKGYGAFWVMKYETTQDQYVAFLNSLNRANQNNYTATSLPPGTISTSARYVMTGGSSLQYRNGIRCPATFHSTKPLTFFCDQDGDGVPDESNDGQTLACNYLYSYGLYFLDWAALRPMTELEFEKICRGPDYAYGGMIAYETAWGLNGSIGGNYTYVNGVINSGSFNEIPANTGIGLVHGGTNNPNGPRRVGSTYTGTSTREQAGSSYYGVADMAGNLYELTVRVMYSSFSKLNMGDGNNSALPSVWSVTGYYRGGCWNSGITDYLQVSNRYYSQYTSMSTYEYSGIRGCRQ
jgi:hypothetical protein